MVEKQKLLKRTHTTGTLSSTAVVSAPHTDIKPPSPTRQITVLSGAASLAPIAAAGAKPIVAMPPLVMNVAGMLRVELLAGAILFQPTSVTYTASRGRRGDLLQRRAG